MSFGIVAGIAGPVIGAIISGNAAEDASNAQVTAANNTNATQLEIYNRTREDQGPWREAGTRALNQMSFGLGLGTLGNFASAAPVPAGVPAAATGAPAGPAVGSLITGPNGEVRFATLADLQAGTVQPAAVSAATGTLNPWEVGRTAPTGTAGDFNTPFGEPVPKPQDIASDPGYQFRLQQGQQALERSAAAKGGLLSGGTMKDLTAYSQGMASQEFQNAYSRYQDAFNRFQADRTSRFNRLASLSGVGQNANTALAQAGQNYGNQVATNNANIGNAQAGAAIAGGNAWNSALGGIGRTLQSSGLFGD